MLANGAAHHVYIGDNGGGVDVGIGGGAVVGEGVMWPNLV